MKIKLHPQTQMVIAALTDTARAVAAKADVATDDYARLKLACEAFLALPLTQGISTEGLA